MALPLPGELPVVKAAEGVAVLDGDLGEVAAGVGLDDVVGDGDVAGVAREEAGGIGHVGDEVGVEEAAGMNGTGLAVQCGVLADVGGVVEGEELRRGTAGSSEPKRVHTRVILAPIWCRAGLEPLVRVPPPTETVVPLLRITEVAQKV